VLIGGAVASSRPGLAPGSSTLYTYVQRVSDDPDLTKPVAFRLTPINGAYIGATRTTPSQVMTGVVVASHYALESGSGNLQLEGSTDLLLLE
jgi:hypothetical protein